MSEINNNEAMEATAEAMSEAADGTDMIVGTGVGAGIGAFVGSKMGYAKALKDAAKATGESVENLRKKIKEAKPAKPQRGKLRWRIPFYREEVTPVEPTAATGVDEEEEKEPEVPAKESQA